MTHAQQAFQHANKAIAHYDRILAGSLSPKQRYECRLFFIQAWFRRAAAQRRIEETERITA